jgi:hypothetical protein
LYEAGAGGALGRVVCVSCNPVSAIGPLGDALLDGQGVGSYNSAVVENWLSRNLSENGRRVFFETPDALVPGDVNSNDEPSCSPLAAGGVTRGCDVYEWEMDGEGSCASTAQDDGCLSLISSGSANEQSYFGDASANGDDVFFFTRQALTPSDEDTAIDVYDAHECVKGEACEEAAVVTPAECGAEGCVPGYTAPPLTGMVSGSSGGSGNLPEHVVPPAKTTTPKPSVAELRAAALKKCRAKRVRRKRLACEAQARKRYPVKAAAKKSVKKAASRPRVQKQVSRKAGVGR